MEYELEIFNNAIDNVDMAKNIIALVDCDSFFVSCEQKVNPELKGKPVCVLSGHGQCVISRSREAKALGIPMGIPTFKMTKEMKKATLITASHDLYYEISEEVMDVLKNISPKVEVYSIDEAFVELTGLSRLYKRNYYELAQMIRQEILEKVDIPVSIGVSTSKTLAKLASDKAKNIEGGVFMVGTKKTIPVLKKTSVDEIWGIGKNLSLKCRQNAILTAYELVQKDDKWLDKQFGIRGIEMKHELLGEQISPIDDTFKPPKSIQKTSAFGIFTSDLDFIKNQLNYHIHSACKKLRKLNLKCQVIGVMLRTKVDFHVYYEKIKIPHSTCYEWEISDIVFKLLEKIYNPNIIYKSSGVVLEDFMSTEEEQMFLFSNNEENEKSDKLAKCLDKLESKFGKNIVKTGFVDNLKNEKEQ
ncbi:hypothetical protein IKU74_00095 [bacterium]|nr:hypothetical protein [bacterium]